MHTINLNQLISKLLISAMMSFVCLECAASFRNYEAAMDDSKWQFVGNPISCQLSHDIPLYGNALFEQHAGNQETLGFKLGYRRNPGVVSKVAAVRSISPTWKPFQTSREMGEVPLTQGRYIIKSQATASWRLLNELETGYFPTFYYQDFNATEDQVAVGLSAVGFNSEYRKFLECVANLVPFKLKELTEMTLLFDFDRASVRRDYRAKLEALAQYIKYDSRVEIVFIKGYTDSKGSRSYNQKLSQKRVDSIKSVLQVEGVSDSRFKAQAFGEIKPKYSNRSPQGRAKNRRVYIKIAQQ